MHTLASASQANLVKRSRVAHRPLSKKGTMNEDSRSRLRLSSRSNSNGMRSFECTGRNKQGTAIRRKNILAMGCVYHVCRERERENKNKRKNSYSKKRTYLYNMEATKSKMHIAMKSHTRKSMHSQDSAVGIAIKQDPQDSKVASRKEAQK